MPNKTDFFVYKRAVKYSPVNAYWLGRCAKLAYHDAARVVADAKQWGLHRVDFIDRSGTQCWVASDAQVVVVAFRGSQPDELADILADLDIRQTNAHGGKVHAGFQRAYAAVRTQVRAKVAAHRTAEQTLWVTGHSLGGAIAVLAAADLTEQGSRVNGIYTFGQPRVGDSAFVSELDKHLGRRLFRLVKVEDPVPEAPPAHCFQHLGQVIYIAPRNRLTLQYKRSQNLINRLQNMKSSLSSHLVEGYVTALDENFSTDPFSTPDAVVEEKPVVTPKQIEQAIERKAERAGKAIDQGIKNVGKNLGRLFGK